MNGKTLTTDGPFVEMRDALGGYLFFEADDLDARTSTPRGVAQFEQLACQRDRLLEVHDQRPLPVGSQPQSPYPLTLEVGHLLLAWLSHRRNGIELAVGTRIATSRAF